MNYKYYDAAFFKGKTLKSIKQIGDDRIEIQTEDGKRYAMLHYQDCCESVTISSVTGDMQKLLGWPLRDAKEESFPKDTGYGHETKTVYTFEGLIETVVITWLGESNGYYSESVQIEEIN